MGFHLDKEYLDLVLVPSGFTIMLAYHLFLLCRYLNLPHTTAIGFENNDKRAWVDRIMKIHYCLLFPPFIVNNSTLNLLSSKAQNVDVAITVISSNISAATYLCSVSLTLSSLIGTWLGSSTNELLRSKLVYSDTSASTVCIKYISLLTCFLLAFSCFVQLTRHFVHASYLISMPDNDVPVKSVELAVIRGGDFWSVGFRVLYFALNILLWFFGPIPMFVSSMVKVVILHCLDTNTTPLHRHGYISK